MYNYMLKFKNVTLIKSKVRYPHWEANIFFHLVLFFKVIKKIEIL